MKTPARVLLLLTLAPLLSSCTFVPLVGKTKEKSWLRHQVAADLVYAEGNVRAYRSAGAYYYFKDGVLVKAGQGLLTADKVQP